MNATVNLYNHEFGGFGAWMVRIVTYVFRMVHIRKVWCILKNSELMKLGTHIKKELGTC